MQNPYAPRAPPPLRHPVPTHPPRKPELPVTPTPTASTSSQTSPSEGVAARRIHGLDGLSGAGLAPGPAGGGYVRYASPPIHQNNNFYGGASTAAATAARSFGGSVQNAYYPGDLSNSPGTPAGETMGNNISGNMGMMGGGMSPNEGMGPMGGNMGNAGHHLGGTMGDGMAGNVPNPASVGAGPSAQFPGWGFPAGGIDPTSQMGMQIGAQFVAAGSNYMQQNVKQWASFLSRPSLKLAFNVSNSYVVHKIRLVLFPWRHKPWSRTHRHTSASAMYGGGMDPAGANKVSAEGFSPPREDVNCPDLYIPSMALVTYILLVAVIHGFQSRFNPQLLGITSSRALGITILEVVFVQLGCYLLNVQSDTTIVDLVAYSGYKFVGTLVTLLVGLLGPGALVYWSVWLYTTAANAFFTLRSLRYVVLPDPSSPSSVTVTHSQRSKRIQFLFAIAVLQLPLCFAMVVGIFKHPTWRPNDPSGAAGKSPLSLGYPPPGQNVPRSLI